MVGFILLGVVMVGGVIAFLYATRERDERASDNRPTYDLDWDDATRDRSYRDSS